jgi:hypothetical protein
LKLSGAAVKVPQQAVAAGGALRRQPVALRAGNGALTAYGARSAPKTATNDGDGADQVPFPNPSRLLTTGCRPLSRRPAHGTSACRCGHGRVGPQARRRARILDAFACPVPPRLAIRQIAEDAVAAPVQGEAILPLCKAAGAFCICPSRARIEREAIRGQAQGISRPGSATFRSGSNTGFWRSSRPVSSAMRTRLVGTRDAAEPARNRKL